VFKTFPGLFAALLALTAPTAAQATPPPSAPTPSQKANYALPMLMRPALAPTLLRLDAAVALQDKATTLVPVLTGAYRLFPDFSVFGRAAMVQQSLDSGPAPTALANPFVFAQYVPSLGPSLKLALFGGSSIPVGAGGGNQPNLASRSAVGAGIYARQGMDNAMFAVNYLTPAAGVGLAFNHRGFTAQAEVTVLQLMRVRGDQLDKDSSRTNFTAATYVGYRVVPPVTVGAEAHYQRWLSTPAAVEKNENLRQQGTVGGNVRFNLPLENGLLMRPSIGYFVGVDKPMTDTGYRIIQLDLPIVFLTGGIGG
jgi:hypothetical protein